MNKYKWIWTWRMFVHEMKYVLIMVVILYAFMCATAQADEVEKDKFGGIMQQLPKGTPRWELTIVQGNDLIDLPHQHNTKSSCVELGITYVRTMPTVKGFVCEQEFD